MAEVIARIATAVVALALIAIFAVELRAHDELANAGQVALAHHPSKAAVDKQVDAMRSIEKWRPGSQPFLASAALDIRTGRFKQALGAAQRATEREPKNFSVWVTLAIARGQLGDRAGQRAAYAKAHALNPLYPIPH
jgi:Flp pilus assembly protein TadD